MEDRIFEKGRIDSLSIYSLLLNSRALQERLDAIALNVWPLILLISWSSVGCGFTSGFNNGDNRTFGISVLTAPLPLSALIGERFPETATSGSLTR